MESPALPAPDFGAQLRQSIGQRIDALDPVTLLRYTYVPFCVAEGVWDYADSIIDMAIQQRRPETKPISRAIRALRRSYDRRRQLTSIRNPKFTDAECQQGELDNYLSVEAIDRELFNQMRSSIRADIDAQHPDLSSDAAYFVASIYQCRAILQALFIYSAGQTEIIRRHLGLPHMADILPSELRALYDIVAQYAGDAAIVPSGSAQFARQFAERLATTQFTDTNT